MKLNKRALFGILLSGILAVNGFAAFEKTNTYADGQFTDVPAN